MRRGALRILMVLCALWPVAAVADLRGDLVAFDACVVEMVEEPADTFVADVIGPIICGELHVPMRQSCTVVEYMLLASRQDCEAADLAFWQAEVDRLEAEALADGRGGVGTLLAIGLAQCEIETVEGPEREACLSGVYWREALAFQWALAQVGR